MSLEQALMNLAHQALMSLAKALFLMNWLNILHRIETGHGEQFTFDDQSDLHFPLYYAISIK